MVNDNDTKKKQMLKITTTTGQVFFYHRADERARISTLPNVKLIEDVMMTPEEYWAIPATDEAKRFFEGKAIGTRPIVNSSEVRDL